MSTQSAFNQLGINAITATTIMENLGLYPEDLAIPQRFTKLQNVINYLKQFPEDTQKFLINKTTRGKNVDRLDHMSDYTQLMSQQQNEQNMIKNIQDERITLGPKSPSDYLDQREAYSADRLARITKELEFFE